MKIVANRQQLVAALTMCKSAAASKSPMVMLQMTLLEPGDGELTVSATDMYVGARVTLAAKVTGDKETIALDAGEILERVRAMPSDEVTLDVKDRVVTITGNKRRFKLTGSADPAPTRPASPEGEPDITIAQGKLAALLTSSGHALSMDRQDLSCLRLVWSSSLIEGASTDGHRVIVEKIEHSCRGTGKALIPARGVSELKKLCEAGDTDISLRFDGPHVFASVDGATVWCKLLGDGYPAVENAIVDRDDAALVVDRKALASAAQAIALSAGKIEGHTQVMLESTCGSLHVSASDADRGEGFEDIECERAGSGWSMQCNAKYLTDALTACASELVSITVRGQWDPIRVEPSEKQTGRSVVAIVMPSVK